MTIIVGAGIAGQLAKKIFPEATMIAESAGKMPIPFYFWKTPETEKLFNECFGGFVEKEIKVGYTGNNYWLYNKVTHKREDNLPCDLKKTLTCLEPKEPFVFREPDQKDTILFVLNNMLVGKLGTYHRHGNERIIWTGHLDETEFWDKRVYLYYRPITYLFFRSSKELFEADMQYFLEDKLLTVKIYRATKTKRDTAIEYGYSYYFEIAGTVEVCERKKLKSYLEIYFGIEHNIKNAKFFTVKKAVCSSKDENFEDQNNVYFVGRYAQNNHDIKANEMISKLYKIKESDF